MTDEERSATSASSGVSPLRKAVSAAILVILLAVLGVEMRAGIGHMQSGEALKEAAPEGVFSGATFNDVDALMVLSPARTMIRETPEEKEYCYRWFSLLRPMLRPSLSCPDTAYYVVVENTDTQTAKRFSEEPPSESEMIPRRVAPADADSSAAEIDQVMGTSESIGQSEGAAPEPLVSVLDSDGDGAISEAEMKNASAALFAADADEDGKITIVDLSVSSGNSVPQRPAVGDTGNAGHQQTAQSQQEKIEGSTE